MHVKLLSPSEAEQALERLSEILVDAVAHGAGVSFMHPLSRNDAHNYWRIQIGDVALYQTFIFVCLDRSSTITGTVMLQKSWAPNQPHRADVAKLLVHSDYRRQGVASALMLALEKYAVDIGLKLITFDAVAGGGAEGFYRTMGYVPVGVIPGYAYSGDGKLDDTMFFYKTL